MAFTNTEGKGIPGLSRRQLATVTAIGALAGSAWAVGMTAIARGRGPQLTTLGSDEWQISLLESGTNRIMILAGEFETSIDEPVTQLLTALRQHVDLVIGTRSGLAQLSMDGRLSHALTIQLDAPPDQPDSPRFRVLRDVMEIALAQCRLRLERVPRGAWLIHSEDAADWLITAEVEDIVVAFAADLEILSRQAPATTALGVAPVGMPVHATTFLPGASFVVNGYGLDREFAQSREAGPGGWLVRTYPRDSARFRWVDGQIMLPDWAQPLFDVTDRT